MRRRNFLHSFAAIPALTLTGSEMNNPGMELKRQTGVNNRLKLSLNAYSFNKPLLDGIMSLDDLLDFCAENGLFAVDITGYYFKGYPEVPSDQQIYYIRKRAFLKGIEISGTGVRNDFTYADAEKRKEEVKLVKKWIDVAAKLGAPAIRIFTGNQNPDEKSWEEVADWVVKEIRECVDYGRQRGVVVYVQNHWDFIKTADQALKIISMVNSDWFGLMLDIGSYRQGDPYSEIANTVKHAMSFQIKENVYVNQKTEKVDLIKLFKIIKSSPYRGYLPLETLEGDPFVRVPAFIDQAKTALESI
jgi:sugar phosphate isomerase/epimerase